MTFRKSNIYNKARVYNKVYGKEIVDKKALVVNSSFASSEVNEVKGVIAPYGR